ncbi:hypothetical protein B566_EDAN017204 [Ephemera danica]|nr:hypothetical protein B566_EDAN017204 [Ephemera danica]
MENGRGSDENAAQRLYSSNPIATQRIKNTENDREWQRITFSQVCYGEPCDRVSRSTLLVHTDLLPIRLCQSCKKDTTAGERRQDVARASGDASATTHLPSVRSGDDDPKRDVTMSAGTLSQWEVIMGTTRTVLLGDDRGRVTTPSVVAFTTYGFGRLVGYKALEQIGQNPKNTITEVFRTAFDQQTAMLFKIFEGENSRSEKNRLLGTMTLNNIRIADRGLVAVDLTFKVDANGILKVTAVEQNTTNSISVNITPYKDCPSEISNNGNALWLTWRFVKNLQRLVIKVQQSDELTEAQKAEGKLLADGPVKNPKVATITKAKDYSR